MRLNYATEYAFRILLYLQLTEEESVSTRKIAEAFQLSVNHLNKVSQEMTRRGLIDSTRGRGGGIRLKEETLSLKIGDVMKSLEPAEEAAQCQGAGKLPSCVISPACQLRGMLGGAQNAFWEYLNQYQIRDLASHPAEMRRLLFQQ